MKKCRVRKSAHVTYDLKFHVVWITKYRKPVLGGKIGERTRELIKMVCKSNEVEELQKEDNFSTESF